MISAIKPTEPRWLLHVGTCIVVYNWVLLQFFSINAQVQRKWLQNDEKDIIIAKINEKQLFI